MAVDDWNTNEALNGTIEGQDVAEGSLPKYLNDVVRRMCASLKTFRNSSYCKDKNVTIQATGGSAPASPADNDLWIEYTP
jgi:hypothetical protein